MYERPIERHGGGRNDDGEMGEAVAIGTDERRMHVRAYNHWVSLLGGRGFPAVHDIEPGANADFGPHSVLLDFRRGVDNPGISYVGELLREECALEGDVRTVADVPPRSLLSRLTDHYLQIIANRAPIGFEAEFVGTRGTTMMYRGILMPFSSDEETIDFIYGVINWKELLDEGGTAELRLELAQAITPDAPGGACAHWADGPSQLDEPGMEALTGLELADGLADRLAAARAEAERARSSDVRSREALYRAIGRAYDVALAAEADPEGYAELLRDCGLKGQARAPMTPIAKLVFGADHDKTRLTEIATALEAARADDLAAGDMDRWLADQPGGLKGVVATARAARRPAGRRPRTDATRTRLRTATPSTVVPLAGEEEFVLIVARRMDGGHVGLLDPITDPKAVDRALATLRS